MLVLFGDGPTQGLDNTKLTAEAKYSINFTGSKKKVCLSMHYNGRFLYVNGVKIYRFQAKDPEIKLYPLCLDNISKDFTVVYMKKLNSMDMHMIFLLIIVLSMSVVLQIFTNI